MVSQRVFFVAYALAMLSSIVLLGALGKPAFGADHPPVSNTSNCHSCHADETRGISVHSAMEAPCATCHFAQTENAKTTFILAMPKEQICFACHEKATTLQQHTPKLQKEQICVSCHDSHSSKYPMLLLATADAQYRATQAQERRHEQNAKPRKSSTRISASLTKSDNRQ